MDIEAVPGTGPAAGAADGERAAPVEWTVVESAVGPLFLAATGRGLVRVEFHADAVRREQMLDRLGSRLGAEPVERASGLLAEPIRRLERYFAGAPDALDLPLDWSLTSGFNRQVLRELAAGVPYGTVVGYGELARRVGQPGAAQAVGAAMGSNPLPVVVPCHRVVESDGGLGGFGGGLETKRRLLELEGVLPAPLF
ncbi:MULTISPECIES: methylated-DNA--[protein]-cysteine S-methyltransferase [Streptomyces]|nr:MULTISPECIES: methylated-DNA--[protein]-cysteine S-methyltransferase [Streptomyces]AVH99850.1 methylated-DNA--[protein]-cysteine S-methyltransferase [Streptomyces sp. WAC00288]MBB4161859.1 methylated-DNA-[protein]-cysteine S-methyltransferase [Streptomyces cinereoruber]MBY8817152.1 methylated-DNA--[protein]-cysteine S-methyltransferase [Streptomyces cinereoruber]NIH64539.1 methylated-DNA-[protein]-cysteine S-methyltransferase [Streptomyces cinereoruber]QEV36723.1 methylated-DNA--[protein]-c